MKNKPAYAIESVDRALRLATLLQHEGSVRVTDAADVLEISPSGAHRLLSMLVYRDFAEQMPDRSYRPGPVLRAAERSDASVHVLRQIAPPRLEALTERVQESANLMVRVGTETRFVATTETDRALRVGDRAGRSLPAHLTSGGQALLARLAPAEVHELYASSDIDVPRLERSLRRVRADGYSINHNRTEDGVTAIGMAVDGADGRPVAAISVGMPSTRFTPAIVPSVVAGLADTRRALEDDLRHHGA